MNTVFMKRFSQNVLSEAGFSKVESSAIADEIVNDVITNYAAYSEEYDLEDELDITRQVTKALVASDEGYKALVAFVAK